MSKRLKNAHIRFAQAFLRANASPLSRRRLLSMTAGGVVAAMTGSALAGCGSNSDTGPSSSINTGNTVPGGTTTYGTPVPFGNGTLTSYVTLQNGAPTRLGVELTPDGLTNLPKPPPGMVAVEVIIPSPPELAQAPPFKSCALYYSPGHPPAGNQDVPHIHPSWYLISDAERDQIPAPSEGYPTTINTDPTIIPANHINGGILAFFARIGALYIDPVTPGYRQTPLSTTEYEYRFYNNKMTLIGLGIANSFPPSKQQSVETLQQPQRYTDNGFFPTYYRVRWNPDREVYDFSIEGFVPRQAS